MNTTTYLEQQGAAPRDAARLVALRMQGNRHQRRAAAAIARKAQRVAQIQITRVVAQFKRYARSRLGAKAAS